MTEPRVLSIRVHLTCDCFIPLATNDDQHGRLLLGRALRRQRVERVANLLLRRKLSVSTVLHSHLCPLSTSTLIVLSVGVRRFVDAFDTARWLKTASTGMCHTILTR